MRVLTNMGTFGQALKQRHYGPFERPRNIAVPIESLDVSAYLVPTDGPEADGALEWHNTLLVLVEARGGGMTGVGYTYLC